MKLAGAILGLALGALTLALLLREEGEPLTAEVLRRARERWEQAGVRDYDLAIRVRGVRSADHEVKVRGGKAVAMKTDGRPAPERIWSYWTVEGLFRSLEEELQHVARVEDPDSYVLEAAFDEQLGYPRRFLRHVLGDGAGIEWKVTSFVRH